MAVTSDEVAFEFLTNARPLVKNPLKIKKGLIVCSLFSVHARTKQNAKILLKKAGYRHTGKGWMPLRGGL